MCKLCTLALRHQSFSKGNSLLLNTKHGPIGNSSSRYDNFLDLLKEIKKR